VHLSAYNRLIAEEAILLKKELQG